MLVSGELYHMSAAVVFLVRSGWIAHVLNHSKSTIVATSEAFVAKLLDSFLYTLQTCSIQVRTA